MYIYKSFGVYFHLPSDTGPIFLNFFFGIGDFLYLNYFFLLNYNVGVFSGHSKLLEKTQTCAERASTFDQGHIFNLDFR